jgi:acyl-CoA dehydrogenase
MVILDLLLLITAILATAYHQLKPLYWAALFGGLLVFLTLLGHSGFFLFLCWGIYLCAALIVLQSAWRRRFLTGRVMQLLKKRLPAMSQNEIEAIQSGDVWWEKDLFSGSPDWNKLLSYPKPTLTQEEQDFLDNQVEKLCAMLDDWQIVRYDHDLPKKVWQYLQQEKFFGLVIPKEYGGLGFSALAHSTIVVKVASRSVSAAVNMMVPNSLGPGELLLHYGTSEQKAYYLPRLAKGEELPCFALTGIDAGSDASSITDTGLVCYQRYQGQKTLGILLNWNKRYITLAPIATILGLAIHLYDPEHLLGEKDDLGITLCLIPTSHPGVEVGRRHLPLYLSFMNGPTAGKDVFIPLEWIIGGPSMAGQGWRMLMECLSIGRSISLPALSASSGKLAYRVTGAYARIRKQFNLPIGYFEGVEELLSSIAGYTYLLEATRLMTAGAVDQKIKPAIASAIAKYHMTELSRQTINDAMDIHAGHTIQTGPHNLLANVYLALPMSITVEGANALTRNLIIFGQGSVVCHPYLLRELELLGSSDPKALDEFDRVFMSHVGYVLRNMARTVWYALTGGRLIRISLKKPQKDKKIIYMYQQLTVVSTALALFTDLILLILGGNLKRRERISARLGDVLSQLYLASAVLKFFQDNGQPADELPYVQWCVQTCLHRTQTAFKELATNFPVKWLGWLLRSIIPFGKIFSAPTDHLSQQIVSPMLSPSGLRDRLTQYFYINKGSEEWLSRLEATFQEVAEIEPLMKKFQNAVRHGKVPVWKNVSEQISMALAEGLLTKEEADRLLDYEKRRHEVIKVSEFSFDLHKVVN